MFSIFNQNDHMVSLFGEVQQRFILTKAYTIKLDHYLLRPCPNYGYADPLPHCHIGTDEVLKEDNISR